MSEENKKDGPKKEAKENQEVKTKDSDKKSEEKTPSDKKEAKAPEKKKEKKRHRPRQKPIPTVDPEFEERVVAVNRVAKVVKGGRRFSFAALMVVGDKKGKVGFGLGKAKEVPEAIKKATQMAYKKMIKVPLDGGTIPHQIIGEHDAGRILFKPASDGTGVKAAGACRAIMELAGVKNVLTKSLRGNNPHNIVKATLNALRGLRTAKDIAAVRGKDYKTIRMK